MFQLLPRWYNWTDRWMRVLSGNFPVGVQASGQQPDDWKFAEGYWVAGMDESVTVRQHAVGQMGLK